MAKIFVICPVTNASEEVTAFLRDYVEGLEIMGYQVHWPSRDTDQSDPHGWKVMTTNCDAILGADEVHIWWDSASTGSHFDRGMLFAMLRLGMLKKVVLINPVERTSGRSFANVFRDLAEGKKVARRDLKVGPR